MPREAQWRGAGPRIGGPLGWLHAALRQTTKASPGTTNARICSISGWRGGEWRKAAGGERAERCRGE